LLIKLLTFYRFDLANNASIGKIAADVYQHGGPVGAVCHGPAGLIAVNINGVPLVKGKKLTGFSNAEEEAVGLTKVVPYSLEDKLKELGGHYSSGENWASHVVSDQRLVTGQNPASSTATAEAMLKLL
jgi:putative intracellular protease/amidase